MWYLLSIHFRCICSLSQYFNRLGAVKQLAYLDRNFFKEELMKKKPVLLTVTSKAQVLGKQGTIGNTE